MGNNMADLCHHCTERGDPNGCAATPCNLHESWLVLQLVAEAAYLQTKNAELRQSCTRLADSLAQECGEDG